jgi:hypothetical protein
MSTRSQSSPLARRICFRPALLLEAELAVERDRRLVVRKDAQGQLVEAALAAPVDRGRDERRADAAAAPLEGDQHPDLAEAEAAHLHPQKADDLAARGRDQRLVEPPSLRSLLHVDRRLGRDPVALLGDRGKELRERTAVGVVGRADREASARPAIHAGFWPAITRRQCPPSPLPRPPSLDRGRGWPLAWC